MGEWLVGVLGFGLEQKGGASTGIALHPYGRTTHALPAGDMHQHKGVSGNGTHPGLGMGKAQTSFWMDHEAACAAAVYCVLTLVTGVTIPFV